MEQLIELLKQPSILYLIIGTLLALYPIYSRLIKWFWTTTKAEVKKEVEATLIKEFKEDTDKLQEENKKFEVLIQGQMKLVSDGNGLLRQAIEDMRMSDDSKNEQFKKWIEQQEQLFSLLETHLEEYKYMVQKVDNHEERIEKIEKSK